MDSINLQEEKFSISEQHGLAYIRDENVSILSPGVSTGGIAEMKMAMGSKGISGLKAGACLFCGLLVHLVFDIFTDNLLIGYSY